MTTTTNKNQDYINLNTVHDKKYQKRSTRDNEDDNISGREKKHLKSILSHITESHQNYSNAVTSLESAEYVPNNMYWNVDDGSGNKIRLPTFPITSQSETFEIMYEDHTLGNLLRVQLSKHPNVLVCNYNLAHPVADRIILHLKTDGTKSPTQVLKESSLLYAQQFDHLYQQMRASVDQYRVAKQKSSNT